MRLTCVNMLVLIILSLSIAFSESIPRRLRRSVDTCGKSRTGSGLIVGGQNFKRGDFPWIVALLHRNENQTSYFCGGTLISSNFVVSAAHCFLEKQSEVEILARKVRALFGAHDLTDHFEPGRYSLSPQKIIIHPEWNPFNTQYDADLALLKFEEGSIYFNDFVQPICLWDSQSDSLVTEGKVVGWGSANSAIRHENVPKIIELPTFDNAKCLPGNGILADRASERTFCAGGNGSGVCFGDSGGGLFTKINDLHYLIGIVSSSPTKDGTLCDVSKNTIYTNVIKFKEWIIDETTAAKKVFCIFSSEYSYYYKRYVLACDIRNQTINKEQFLIGSPKNTSIERFDASYNKQMKFVPRGIGEKFPNLKTFLVFSCGLTIVRDFYFKNMQKLEVMRLSHNQIKTIEPKAFDDLVSLSELDLDKNQIETLDEKLFVKLVNLVGIYLYDNKIKFLSPTTFKIPGNGKLWLVRLSGNVCINKEYGRGGSPLSQLESDLRTNCLQ